MAQFANRGEWAEHEFSHHRVDHTWQCPECARNCTDPLEWEKHLLQRYQRSFTGSKLLTASNMAYRADVRPSESQECPLCRIVLGKPQRAFVKHVCRHMEEIALIALPRDNVEDSEQDSTSTVSNNERHADLFFCRYEECPNENDGGFSSIEDRDKHEVDHGSQIQRCHEDSQDIKDEMQRIHELKPSLVDFNSNPLAKAKNPPGEQGTEDDIRVLKDTIRKEEHILSHTVSTLPAAEHPCSDRPPSKQRMKGLRPVRSPVDGVTYSRLPHDDELYVMRVFARHASHCSTCAHPYEVHKKGGFLCNKGRQRALDVTQYVLNIAGQAYSMVDREGKHRVQLEIPADCNAVRELLKALERGLHLRRKPRGEEITELESNEMRKENTIKCICGFQEDDGNTTFCERCETWQHTECYYIDEHGNVPSIEDILALDHFCAEFQPRRLDRQGATQRQLMKRSLGRAGK